MIDTFRVHSGNVMISQVQFVLVMYVYRGVWMLF